MIEIKKRKLDLKIIPALIPLIVGVAVALLAIGDQIGMLIFSLVVGYFAFLLASLLIELIEWLKSRTK